MNDGLRRGARVLLCVAAVATGIGAAGIPGRHTAGPPPPTVIVPAPEASRPAASAWAGARRFLALYAAASDGRLSAAGRRSLAAASASQLAEVLLEQPPEKIRRGGRIARLVVDPAGDGDFDAVASLDFAGLSEAVRLTLARYPGGGWRVTALEPSVVTPNRGARH